jgi:hypothetical protein
LARKQKLQEIKRVIDEEVISLRDSYNKVHRHIDEFEFTKAIEICRKCAKPSGHAIKVVSLFHDKFQEMLHKHMPLHL